MKPIFLIINTRSDLDRQIKELKPVKVVDIFRDLWLELFSCQNPKVFFGDKQSKLIKFEEFMKKKFGDGDNVCFGQWVYFPWNQELYHMIDGEDYFTLRTIRNRNLVSKEEQNKLGKSKVAIAGLSVGKNALLSLIRYGIGNDFCIAENDVFEMSNANRAMYDLTDYHQSKLESCLHDVWQIDPFIRITSFSDGLNESNLAEFVGNAELIIDTFDQFPIKIILRKIAREKGIPVISGADLEKGVLLTIERYDIDKDLDLSLYLNGQNLEDVKKQNITKQDITNFFIKMIGAELHSKKMMDSVLEVGKTLTSYPQLIVATQLFASVVTVAAEAIVLDKPMLSGRYHIDLPNLLTVAKC